MTLRVSVLLPCYNGESYLEEAVRSILDQSFIDFELIVIDDGSHDSSSEILARLSAEDVRLRVVTKPNGGIVSALNAGLAVCRGEYVARMDADDIAFRDRFEFQVKYLDEHPECVLVGGYALNTPKPEVNSVRTTGGRHRRTNLRRFPPAIAVAVHPLIMVRRHALEEVGGYRSEFSHAEDYDLFIRLASFGTIDNPPKDLLFYRRHENAVSLRHLETQERSAASAEFDAMRQANIPVPDEWICESYIRLRIWRRYRYNNRIRAREMMPRVIADLINLHPKALFSWPYFGVRIRILSALLRWYGREFIRYSEVRRGK